MNTTAEQATLDRKLAEVPIAVTLQHPAFIDAIQGVTFRLHCSRCGTYVEDQPLSQGIPAVDYLCAGAECDEHPTCQTWGDERNG